MAPFQSPFPLPSGHLLLGVSSALNCCLNIHDLPHGFPHQPCPNLYFNRCKSAQLSSSARFPGPVTVEPFPPSGAPVHMDTSARHLWVVFLPLAVTFEPQL